MKSFIVLIASLIMLVCSCTTKNRRAELNVPADSIHLSAFNETVIRDLPPGFVKSREYINLQMKNDENYVTAINKILVAQDRIYVMDKRGRTLVAFDSKGNYLDTVGKVMLDYVNIADFDADSTGLIYIIDGKKDNLLCYNADFKLMYKKQSPFEIDVIQSLPGKGFLLGLSSWNKMSNAHDKVVLADRQLAPVNVSLKYEDWVDDNFWVSGYRFLKAAGVILYNRPVDNNVYAFSPDGKLNTVYSFDFGAMNVPDEHKKDIEKHLYSFDHYRLLTDFTFADNRRAFGKLWDKRKHRFFYADRTHHIIYLEDPAAPNELKNIADFDGKYLISFILPGEYSDTAFGGLPDASRKQLAQGGMVICRYELN